MYPRLKRELQLQTIMLFLGYDLITVKYDFYRNSMFVAKLM
ncbi:hypothetical protein P886_0002 [Alteromonadaceae bacterium 2753L.S.0a.02]|nr:hypothetical protein P886_0002 [Alteromonadaceae bacterium 2753L.S.0a.02]